MKPRKPKKLPVAISEAEFTKLVAEVKKMHHKVAFLLGFGSGLRISEVINLQPKDIDMKEKRILVVEGKGKKDRVVPLPKGFREYHIKYIPLSCKARALQKAFKFYCEKAGLLEAKPTLHFHSLRHGFATQCVRKGVKLSMIQMMMGHADISTTGIYIQLNPEEALNEYQDKF